VTCLDDDCAHNGRGGSRYISHGGVLVGVGRLDAGGPEGGGDADDEAVGLAVGEGADCQVWRLEGVSDGSWERRSPAAQPTPQGKLEESASEMIGAGTVSTSGPQASRAGATTTTLPAHRLRYWGRRQCALSSHKCSARWTSSRAAPAAG